MIALDRTLSRALGFASIGLALALAGCETPASRPSLRPGLAVPAPPPPPTREELLAAEFAWSTHPGANGLLGKVSYRSNGESWTCAGQSVALAPETRTSARHMQELYGSAQAAVESIAVVRARSAASRDPDFGRWVRTSVCDAKSGFGFAGLPDGGYFVITRIHPRKHGGSDQAELALMQRVELRGGAVRSVVLPERPRPS